MLFYVKTPSLNLAGRGWIKLQLPIKVPLDNGRMARARTDLASNGEQARDSLFYQISLLWAS